jgi:hypothetical protein
MPRVGALHTYFREFSGNDLFVVLLDWLGIYKLQHCVGHNIHASRQVDAQASPNLSAGFQLPDEYHTPALGKVWRPGGVIEDIGHRKEEEWEAEKYMEQLDALETEV